MAAQVVSESATRVQIELDWTAPGYLMLTDTSSLRRAGAGPALPACDHVPPSSPRSGALSVTDMQRGSG